LIALERVDLCPFTWEQAQQYLGWVNQQQLAQRLIRVRPVSPGEHQRWYDSLVSRSDAVVFSVVHREWQQYLGNCWLWGIHPVHRSAELRILFGHERANGQGLGSEACRGLVNFAFQQLNLEKVFLYVLVDNPAAVRCFEKAGFVTEARLEREYFVAGAYRDGLRMARWRDQSP